MASVLGLDSGQEGIVNGYALDTGVRDKLESDYKSFTVPIVVTSSAGQTFDSPLLQEWAHVTNSSHLALYSRQRRVMAPERSSHIPEDTYEELIEATITALYETGYADLGVRDIDAAFNKSRQLINHYFDGKDELITEVLEYLLHDDEARAAGSMDADPLTKLTSELDSILLGTTTDDTEFWPIMTAVYEIQAQAHHNPEHQRLLNRISESYVSYLSGIIGEGIEEGVFRDVDERRMATLLDDLVTGAHVRKVHLGQDEAPADARETIDRLVLSHLLVDPDGDGTSPE